MTDLKARIQANTFVSAVRNELRFDQGQYDDLRSLLTELAAAWKGDSSIDKELALELYTIPQIVRNAYLSFSGHPEPLPRIVQQLEDAWVDLDALILECLSGRPG